MVGCNAAHPWGSCAPRAAAAEFAGNNQCCLSQKLISEADIIASLILLEGCIEFLSSGYRAAKQIDWGCLRMLMRSTESEMSIGGSVVNNDPLFSFVAARVTGMGSAALECWSRPCGLSRLPRSQ